MVMTFPGDHDSGLEELLRSVLKGEADGISPAGDGLGRIQQRIAARRSRRLWLRPVAVLGAVTVAAGAGFAAYALSSHPDESASVLIKPTTPVPSTAATTPPTSPTPTLAPTAPVFPATAFYPFTSAAGEQSWEAQRGPATQPWVVDPVAEAKDFVARFVLADGVTDVLAKQVSGSTAAVTLGRTMTDGSSARPISVTTVRLQRFGKAWLVLGADDARGNLAITSPAAGAAVTSPVTVSGPGFGVDEAVQVDVRAIGAPWLTASRGQASFGNGVAQWSTTVAFSPPADPRGAVVVVENSAADGGPSRIAVTPVTFAPEQTGYPAYFYGVKDNRVTKFSARSGAAVAYLTAAGAGVVTDPQLASDRIYFLSGSGTCANVLRSVPTSGGASTLVASPKAGYSITSFAVTPDNTKTALFETSCLGTATPQGLLVSTDNAGSQTHTVPFDSFPPELIGDPSWEPDGRHLDTAMVTGMNATTIRYDAFAAKAWGDGNNPCSGGSSLRGRPTVVDADTSGAVWVGMQNGGAIDVERCLAGTPRLMFTVANAGPADIAVAGSGTAVLVSDSAGHVWRWTQGGTVTQLSPSVPVTRLTW
jgi:hypothetical protein